MGLYLVSFHDIDEELGGCVMRGETEEQAVAKVRQGNFIGKLQCPPDARVLITLMTPESTALVPEHYIDRLLRDDEFDALYEILLPAALIPEGPELELAGDLMTEQVNQEIARGRR